MLIKYNKSIARGGLKLGFYIRTHTIRLFFKTQTTIIKNTTF